MTSSWLSVIVTLTRPIREYVYELDTIDVWKSQQTLHASGRNKHIHISMGILIVFGLWPKKYLISIIKERNTYKTTW